MSDKALKKVVTVTFEANSAVGGSPANSCIPAMRRNTLGIVAMAAVLLLAAGALAQVRTPIGLRTGLGQGANRQGIAAPGQQAHKSTAPHRPRYMAIPIDPPAGKTHVFPFAVNNKGDVAGTAFNEVAVDGVAFLWPGKTSVRLPAIPESCWSVTWQINDLGQMVGQHRFGNGGCPAGCDAPYAGWFSKPGLKEYARLAALGENDNSVLACSINHAGQMVGASGSGECSGMDAVLWESEKSKPVKLQGVDGFAVFLACSINNHRPPQMAGGVVDANIPLFWSRPDAAPEVLPNLNSQAPMGFAACINDNQQIFGMSITDPNDPWGSCHAVLWEKGTVTDLTPDLKLSGYSAFGGLNNLGQAVGWAVMGDGQSHAMLWQKKGQQVEMIDLNDALEEPINVLLGCGDAINDQGWIVADGPGSDGRNHGVLLVPRD
jgi:hypothetical protein